MSLALLYFQKTPKDRFILAHNSESYIKYPRNFTKLYQKILCNEDEIQDSSVAIGSDGRFIISINNYEEIPGSEDSQPFSKKSLLMSFIRGKMSSSDFVKSLTSIKVSDYGSFQLVVSDGQVVHLFHLKFDGSSSILVLSPGFYSFTSCPAKAKFIKTFIHPWIVQYLQSESTFRDRTQLASTLINILWKHQLIQSQSSTTTSTTLTTSTSKNEEGKEEREKDNNNNQQQQIQQQPLIPTINKKDEDTTKDVAKEKIPEATTAVVRKTINGEMNPAIENFTEKTDIMKRIEQPFVNLLKIDGKLYGTSHSYVIINNLNQIDHYESYIGENSSYIYWSTLQREFNMELKCNSERPISLSPKGFNNLDFSILEGAAGPLEEQIRLKQIYISDAKIAKPPRKRKPYQHRTEKTKGYLTAYNIFARDNRSKIVSELEDNKSLKNNDINKKLGEMWKKISREEKLEYERKSYEDKIRYFKELREKGIEDIARIKPPKGFEEAIGNEKNEIKIVTKHVARKRKGPFDPKRFKTNYVFFATEQRRILQKKFPKLAFSEIGCIIGEKWRNLSEKEKEKYNRAAEADKERYRREVQEQNDQEIAIETLQNLADSSIATTTDDDNKSNESESMESSTIETPETTTTTTIPIPLPSSDLSTSLNQNESLSSTDGNMNAGGNNNNVIKGKNGYNIRGKSRSIDKNNQMNIDPDYIEDDILTLANEATNSYINNKEKKNGKSMNYSGMTTRSRSRGKVKNSNARQITTTTTTTDVPSVINKQNEIQNEGMEEEEEKEGNRGEEEGNNGEELIQKDNNSNESRMEEQQREEGKGKGEKENGKRKRKGKDDDDFITHILNAASDMNHSDGIVVTDKETTMEIEESEKENTNLLSNDNSVSKDQNLDMKSKKRVLQACLVTEESCVSPTKKTKNN